MFKYRIQAYNDSPYGPANEILVVVTANNEAEAKERAHKIVPDRTHFSVVEIEEPGDFNKLQTVPPTTVKVSPDQAKKLKKG